jgi:hypothetical protein
VFCVVLLVDARRAQAFGEDWYVHGKLRNPLRKGPSEVLLDMSDTKHSEIQYTYSVKATQDENCAYLSRLYPISALHASVFETTTTKHPPTYTSLKLTASHPTPPSDTALPPQQ